jgi:hypothetical protein
VDSTISVETRIPAIKALVSMYAATVYLSVQYAFTEEMRPSQRILCGAASFVMLGFMFTDAHGAVAALEGLCGILYPATLIARIAAITERSESGKCW